MRYRFNAIKTISRRRIFETLISPGFYIIATVGMILGYFLISGFVSSVDSSGFNPELNPVYDQIARMLSSVFGTAFIEKLFSEGPFIFSFFISFIPLLIYLSISSVIRFGFEKNVGALELIVYGPSDGTSFFLSFLVKDLFLTVLYIIALALFFTLSALVNNLVLGRMFFFSILLVFFLTSIVYTYGILTSVLTDNATSSVALFLGIMVFFTIIQIGSFSLVRTYVRSFSTAVAWIIKWISPLFYMSLGFKAINSDGSALFVLSLFLCIVLSSALLFASHIILKERGIR
jgi:hypothetical protein